MISWIQITFQKHFRAVFAVLLFIIIISFVFTIGASPGIGTADRSSIARPFLDLNLSMAADQQKLLGGASLSAFVQLGTFGLDSEQLQQYAMQRYAALYQAKQLQLPDPTQAQLTEFIQNLRPFRNSQTGEFDAIAYNRFRDGIRKNKNFSESEIARVLNDDYRVDRIQKLLAGPGYVTSADVAEQLSRSETLWTLATASIEYASYQPQIETGNDILSRFFEENAFRYEIAPRFSGAYATFDAQRYLSQVTITESEAKAYFDTNPQRFAPAPSDSTKPEAPILYDSVKDKVSQSLRLDKARRLAQKSASDFTVMLFETKAEPSQFQALVEKQGASYLEFTPFARTETPKELPGVSELVEEAFKLDATRPFTDAISTETGAVVAFYKETIPSRKPHLEEVREKVRSDYLETERRRLFVELGRSLKAAIEQKLSAGKAFSAAAKEATATAGLTAETKDIAAFTLRQPPQDLDYSAFALIEKLKPGSVSDMALTGPKGLIVFVQEKKLPVTDASNPNYSFTKTRLAQTVASTTGAAILGEVLERELKPIVSN